MMSKSAKSDRDHNGHGAESRGGAYSQQGDAIMPDDNARRRMAAENTGDGSVGTPPEMRESVPADPTELVWAALRQAAGSGSSAAAGANGGTSSEGLPEVGDRASTACPSCEHEGQVTTRLATQRFQYGNGADAVTLEAEVPVRACGACGFEFLDAAAERARHDAICRHLGRLTPSEVRMVRRRAGDLSRQEFAELTGIGEASLGRWESGAQIQNVAMDRLLRLTTFADNVERLRNAAAGELVGERRILHARTRAVLDEERVREYGRGFRLAGGRHRRTDAA